MKNKMLVNLLMISILSLSFNSCSKSDSAASADSSLKQKIIGKWKFTKESVGGYTTDYSSSKTESTEEYLKDGTVVLDEWGEVSYWTYKLSDNTITMTSQSMGMLISEIMTLNDTELVLNMIDEGVNKPVRIRYYIRIN